MTKVYKVTMKSVEVATFLVAANSKVEARSIADELEVTGEFYEAHHSYYGDLGVTKVEVTDERVVDADYGEGAGEEDGAPGGVDYDGDDVDGDW